MKPPTIEQCEQAMEIFGLDPEYVESLSIETRQVTVVTWLKDPPLRGPYRVQETWDLL